ncbi:MAG: hypothetical protein H6834_17720 [Planctomycetes bacterium]|nr:hypothetical protein [Planctomycetota bacterium]
MRISAKRRVRIRLVARERHDLLTAIESVEDAMRPAGHSNPNERNGERPAHRGQVTDEMLEAQAIDRARRRLDGKSHRPPVQELQQTVPHEEQARTLKEHLERRTFIGIRRLAVDCVRTSSSE